MTDPASQPPRSGAHHHPDLDGRQVEVVVSREIREELHPLVAELRRLIDRIEQLPEFATRDEEQPPNGTGPRS